MLGSWHLVMPMYFSLMFGEGLSAAAVALSCRAIPEPRCGQALWPWGPASLAQAVFIILPHPHLVPSGDQGPQTGIESGPDPGRRNPGGARGPAEPTRRGQRWEEAAGAGVCRGASEGRERVPPRVCGRILTYRGKSRNSLRPSKELQDSEHLLGNPQHPAED